MKKVNNNIQINVNNKLIIVTKKSLVNEDELKIIKFYENHGKINYAMNNK